MNTSTANKRHVYPIVRVDLSLFAKDRMPENDEFEQFIHIVKVMNNEREAQIEVERLNQINAAKNTLYFYRLSHMAQR